jgi:hypothetical protein
LAFGGNITASVVGGRFANNLAGTALLVMQQASLTAANTSVCSSGGSSGVGAWALDNSTLQIGNSGFVKLAAAESGAAVFDSNTSKVWLQQNICLCCTSIQFDACMQSSMADMPACVCTCICTSWPTSSGVDLNAVMCGRWHLLFV